MYDPLSMLTVHTTKSEAPTPVHAKGTSSLIYPDHRVLSSRLSSGAGGAITAGGESEDVLVVAGPGCNIVGSTANTPEPWQASHNIRGP